VTPALASLALAHHPGFAAAGAALAVLGALGGFRLLRSAIFETGRSRLLLGALAGLVSALGAWTAHYVSVMGGGHGLYQTHAAHDLGVTLAIALLGFGTATQLVSHGQSRLSRLLAGGVAGGALLGMHLIGHPQTEAPVALVEAAAAAGWSFGLCLVAFALQGSARLRKRALGATILAVAMTGLHYVALPMAGTLPGSPPLAEGADGLRLALVGLGISILTVVIVAVVSVDLWSRFGAVRQLRHAIDAMPDGLAFYDAEDRLQLWNVRYAELVADTGITLKAGLSYSRFLALAANEACESHNMGAAWLRKRLEARRQLGSTMEQRLPDGRWLRIQDRRTADGGTVTVMSDITDLKQVSETLSAARDAAEAANRAKSQFLANMSHEIRTPLNGVIGVAQALADTPLNARQTEMLELIQSSGSTLRTLLSDILDLARVESGRMSLREEPVALARAVREAADLYEANARDKGLQFYVDIAPDADIWVLADVVRLKQILTNLVSNAVKFTEAGFVSLRVSRSPEGDPSPTLRFSVEDTGLGFDAATRSRLFARFEQADGSITRRYGGTGLGLAICRQLADMMGGSLDCESEPGGGSAFFLTVPLKPAEPPTEAKAEPETAKAQSLQHLSILVADDHPVNRRVVELILESLDVDITTAEDGLQALAAYGTKTFDLILMDMQMPEMDGLAATAAIRGMERREGRARTPIVMLTANALPEHVEAAQAAGADRHLAKPFSAPDLIGLVTDLVTTSATEQAAA
jgi:signal transduction histidine kinase/ActR/RegA family two-component response regulator